MDANTGNSLSGNYDLTITNVQLEDEDVYQCQVTNCNVQSSNAMLVVLVPPHGPIVIDEAPDGEYRVIVEETILIRCEAWNAKPAADVSWFKGNDQIIVGVEKQIYPPKSSLYNSSATLSLTPNLADDREVYTCIMNNDALIAEDPAVIPAQKKDITLVVLVPPIGPTIEDYDPSIGTITVAEGEPITITCRAENGKPTPNITWYRGGIALTTNVDVETSPSDSYGRRNVTAYMRMVGNITNDNIRFTCAVWNEALAVSSTSSFILEVTTPLGTGAIIGIIVAIAVIILLLLLLVYILCKKRKTKKNVTDENTVVPQLEISPPTDTESTSSTSEETSSQLSMKKEISLDLVEPVSEDSLHGAINIAYDDIGTAHSGSTSLPPFSESSESSCTTSMDEEDIEEPELPGGDIFSISSSLQRSERGSPVDLLDELEILSVSTPRGDSWARPSENSPFSKYLMQSQSEGMITIV
uniref:hemicentin-1-like n=1 Tax=Styela clava TaxID=7725 RepID=UPI00193A2200|nr:hemicentin-1-like [Styela clava]